jgi:hypothetical protein
VAEGPAPVAVMGRTRLGVLHALRGTSEMASTDEQKTVVRRGEVPVVAEDVWGGVATHALGARPLRSGVP